MGKPVKVDISIYRSVGGDVVVAYQDDDESRSTVYDLSSLGAIKAVYGEGGTILETPHSVNLALDLFRLFEAAERRAAVLGGNNGR